MTIDEQSNKKAWDLIEKIHKQRGQKKSHSLLESFINIVVGFTINFLANMCVFPLFGWHISVRQNLLIGVIYTVISLVRSYCLRRVFNRLMLR